MARLRYDNSFGTLGANQGIADTTITFAAPLTYADGVQVPTLTGGNTLDITVEPNTTRFEVERITAYTQGALTATVTRGISGSPKAHQAPATFGHNPTAGGDFNGGTPSLSLGTTNTAGTSGVPFDAASAVAVFDATVPVTQNYGDVAATGAAAVAARRDHKHGMPAATGVSWPLTNTGDEGFQPNSIANNTLNLHNVASSVNGVQITGAATGAVPMVSPIGSDSVIGLLIQDKNAGGSTSGTITLQSGNASAALSYGSSNSGTWSLNGVHDMFDRGPGLAIRSNSAIYFRPEGQNADAASIDCSASVKNGISLVGAGTGNAPKVTAASFGSDSNVDLTLGTVGSGLINIGYATTALGGGAAPTLGTIGGSGPATAAQNSWLAIKINGTTSFLPVWR